MLKGSKVNVGNKAEFIILGGEPNPTIPTDLSREFKSSPVARTTWDRLNQANHRDWIRWINWAKKDETRALQISRAIDTLPEANVTLTT